ncbi:MAG: valine--tRNA ligase [Candidatus Heimdallarchaeota archaeon]|nr:MAG: valine--tRNA ligase [Candidatus Heimdallarchaeota archaeon]
MNKGLDNSYNHPGLEEEIYEWWEKEGFFRPEKQIELGLIEREKSPRFCITIPLPNVTGQLHLGHAVTISLEDLMTRFERMKQKEALFIPGTDHAGIATQNVVERELLKQGINRKDLGREQFIDKVWEWKDKYHARITEQSKRMGMSSDWNRERFTLDSMCTRAVREAFYRLYTKGLIYRGEYMINWCPRCESAISDLETESEEKASHLWYIKYPIMDEDWKKPRNKWGSGKWAEGVSDFIVVATTRPETLLGDTAVAIAANHKEYGKFVNTWAILPVNAREIPIIVDEYVDPEFGTGALKITPGHDPNDFEIGQRHNLEVITILDESVHLLPDYSGPYAGMTREEGREAIIKDLKKEGLLEKIEPYLHQEPHCQRCHTVIEPRVSLQWFVKTKPLAEAAMEKVRQKETIIIPEREEKRFFQWMENIHDWCISRQLWWGHRIPIWYCDNCNKEICPLPDVEKLDNCPKCGSGNLTQENDVLDTWFSSGLWPFSTLGWPNTDNPDYKRFFPTDTRETGYDILFFWVAREMMLGIELTGMVPYRTVYLHGLIRDERGRKISKSMEDVDKYDPLHIISEHGADSLRYVLISNSIPGLDTNLDPRQLDAAHHFLNKVWQSTRFVLNNIHEAETLPRLDEIKYEDLRIPDRWILSRLNYLVKTITECMENYDYLKASREIKNFYWNEFCDWYIEITKIRLYGEEEKDKIVPKVILLHILDTAFKLLHPIVPFVTEKLWRALPNGIKSEPALIVAKWPEYNKSLIDEKLEEEFQFTIDLIHEIRRIRAVFNVGLTRKIPLQIQADDSITLFENTKEEIIALAKIDPEKLTVSSELEQPKRAARVVIHEITAYIPLEEIINLEEEKEKVKKRLNNVKQKIHQINAKLSGPFSQKAPKDIIEKEKEKLNELDSKKSQLEEQLEILT